MDNDQMNKVRRLNELFSKQERGENLTPTELTEQSILRDEFITYFQYAARSLENSTKK